MAKCAQCDGTGLGSYPNVDCYNCSGSGEILSSEKPYVEWFRNIKQDLESVRAQFEKYKKEKNDEISDLKVYVQELKYVLAVQYFLAQENTVQNMGLELMKKCDFEVDYTNNGDDGAKVFVYFAMPNGSKKTVDEIIVEDIIT